MIIKLMAISLLLVLTACTAQEVTSDEPRHGEVSDISPMVTWDKTQQIWVSPEVFWHKETDARGGLTWPKSTVSQKYENVAEFDTFLVEGASGTTCLMAFYHSRWRRANDVWRWDDAFNNYGACPHVFD